MQWVYTHAVAKSTFVAFSLLERFFFLFFFWPNAKWVSMVNSTNEPRQGKWDTYDIRIVFRGGWWKLSMEFVLYVVRVMQKMA